MHVSVLMQLFASLRVRVHHTSPFFFSFIQPPPHVCTLLLFLFIPPRILTVFQLSDSVADGIDALVYLLVLALRLLPHRLALLLQHLYLPLQFALQVLHPPGALSAPRGGLRWGLGGRGSRGGRAATPWGSRCRWGGSTAGGRSGSLAGVTSRAAAATTVAATCNCRCVGEVQGCRADLCLQQRERETR